MNVEVANWLHKGNFLNFKGYKVFYLQEGSGEDLLVIHGYPYNTFEWKEAIQLLSAKYKVTAFDLLGMGFSEKPQEHQYSYEEYCEIVNNLLETLNITHTHILAHDLGVSVAQELIAGASEGKNKFTILSSAFTNGSLFIDVYKPRFIQRLLSQTPDFIGRFISNKISKGSINKSVRSVFGKDTQPTDDMLDKQWEILNYNNGKAISYLIGRLVFEKKRYLQRWVNAMQNTQIPMCYICGPADPNSGIHMLNRYKELIPNPKVYLLADNIGHWPFVEDLHGFMRAYESFRN